MTRSDQILAWAKSQGKTTFTQREAKSGTGIPHIGHTLSSMVRSGKLKHHLDAELIMIIRWFSVFGYYEVIRKST